MPNFGFIVLQKKEHAYILIVKCITYYSKTYILGKIPIKEHPIS